MGATKASVAYRLGFYSNGICLSAEMTYGFGFLGHLFC